MRLLTLLIILLTLIGCQKKEITEPPVQKKIHRPSPAEIKNHIEDEEEVATEETRGVAADDFEVGKNISELLFKPLDGNKKVTLGSVMKKRGAVIDFWSTWCRPCVLMLPDMQKVHKQHAKNIAVISISLDPSQSAASKTLKENECTFPTFTGETALMNSGIILPQTIIVNTKGVVTFVGHGRHTFDEIVTMVNKYNR